MTTKVEPTVEKWESDFDKKFDYRPYREGDSWYTILDKKDYNPASLEQIKDFIRHSVQEAKAEGAQEAMKEAVNNFRWILEKTLPETGAWVDRQGRPITAEEIAYLVDVEYGVDLLSTLNTKASLKQEGGK